MADHHEKPYLIIVEDEINFGESLQLSLNDVYDVAVTLSVEKAKKAFREKFPSVALIDMRLPDGNGIDVLRELKRYGEMPLGVLSPKQRNL